MKLVAVITLSLSLHLYVAAAADVQNVVPLCEETHCPPLDCENPIRVDGQCCAVCMQPGAYTVTFNNSVKWIFATCKVCIRGSVCVYWYLHTYFL